MEYFDQILDTYTFQHCLMTDMHNILFDGQGFAEHESCGAISYDAAVVATNIDITSSFFEKGQAYTGRIVEPCYSFKVVWRQ